MSVCGSFPSNFGPFSQNVNSNISPKTCRDYSRQTASTSVQNTGSESFLFANSLSGTKNTNFSTTSQQTAIQPRRVRFHASVKRHDGLQHRSDMFHEYMKDIFRQVVRINGETTISILARNFNVLGIVTIQKMLIDLIKRCRQSPTGQTPVLNHGGGSVGSINTAHIPYLITHAKYLDQVIAKVRLTIPTRSAQK